MSEPTREEMLRYLNDMRKSWKMERLPLIDYNAKVEEQAYQQIRKLIEQGKRIYKQSYDYIWINGELEAVDDGLGILILQLNMAGIKTLGSCSGHSNNGYPSVLCAPGTEEKLREFGCKIVTTRKDDKVIAYFPCRCFSGRLYPYRKKETTNAIPDWCLLEDEPGKEAKSE